MFERKAVWIYGRMKKRDEYVVNGRICIYQLTAPGEWVYMNQLIDQLWKHASNVQIGRSVDNEQSRAEIGLRWLTFSFELFHETHSKNVITSA